MIELLTSRGPALPLGLLARSIARAGRVRGAYFRWRDPGPGAALLGAWVKAGARRLTRPGGAATAAPLSGRRTPS
jgi:hypothetical protein